MSPRDLRGTTIAGTGMYVPDRVLTNADFERMVDTSDEWIVERTGIRERHIAAPEQVSSDLATAAARRALEMANVDPTELDHIVLATTTPDRLLPSCACTVQRKLGATRAAAYDVFAACTGFIFGLGIGRGLIGSGIADTVLVIGVEMLSRIVDYTDRNTCVLFGDGGGAVVLRPCPPGEGILAVDMHSDGTLGDVLEIKSGVSQNPASERTVREGEHFLRMQGKKLFPFAVRSMEDSIRRCLDQAGLGPEDLDLLIPHQANIRIIDGVRERLGVPPDRVYVNIDRYGNTSSASIPIALDELVRAGRIAPGDAVAFAAFGGGATWGGSVMKWTLPVEIATAKSGSAALATGAPAAARSAS